MARLGERGAREITFYVALSLQPVACVGSWERKELLVYLEGENVVVMIWVG